MSNNRNWGSAPQESNTAGNGKWGSAPQESNTAGNGKWGSAPQESNTAGNGKWGSAPQESNTAGNGKWGSAPQESNTAGNGKWGSAPQESNTGAQVKSTPLTDTPEYSFYIIEGVTYKVRQLISSQSGEAKIFRIENDGKDFALKLYRPGVKPNHEVLDKVMKLRGNGLLVDIYAHGVWHDDITGADLDYEIMQYLSGGSMASLELGGDERRMKEIAAGMAAALDFAHKHGILHRDVKPANFLFTDSGKKHFVLTDWGLAKLLDGKGRTVTDAGRTKIYAAPEMYTYIPGTPTYVGTKADFFSMGMALLALWKGEGNLIADERRLVHDKQEETLPYPLKGEMSEHLLSLIKALTRRNPEKRAGFDDIVRWAKGEIIFKEEISDDISEYRIVFSSAEKLIAHNNKELAAMMETHPDLAKKYLYTTDTLTKKFREIDRPEIAVELESITEIRYPGNQDAGLYAAILLLDPEKPYIGISGNKCHTQKEIANEIFRNNLKYSKELGDPNHKMWVFLESSGLGRQIKGMAAEIKKSPNTGTRKLYYMLDPTLPYLIVVNNKTYSVNSLAEYADLFIKHGGEIGFQTAEGFLTWLATRDKTLAGKAKKIVAEKGTGRFGALCVHYAILPDRGYDLLPIGESMLADSSDIALELVGELDGSISPDSGTEVSRYLDSLDEFRKSPLLAYLLSKGIYDDHIEYIMYALDFSSEDFQRKSAPYTRRIAKFKIVSALLEGLVPITINGKDLNSPKGITVDLIRNLTPAQADLLADWAAVFYHENPRADYRKKSYYRRSAEYYGFLANHLPQCSYCRNAANKTGGIAGLAKDAIKEWRKVTVVKWIMTLLCLIPMLLALGLCSYAIVTEGAAPLGSALESIGWWVAVVAGGIIGLWAWAEAGLIWAVIAYFVTAGIVKVIFSFLSGIAPWIVVALLLGIAIYFILVIFRKSSSALPDKIGGFTLYEAFEREYVGAAFGSRGKLLPGLANNMPVQVLKDCKARAKTTFSQMIRNMVYMLVITGIAVFFCGWLLSDKPVFAEENKIERMLQGDFRGNVSGTPSEMSFTTSESGEITADMTISYRAGMTQQTMRGTNRGKFPIVLTNESNSAVTLSIENISVDNGTKIIQGSYVNSKGNVKTVNYKSYELQKVQ